VVAMVGSWLESGYSDLNQVPANGKECQGMGPRVDGAGTVREEQARRTRRRVVDAGRRLFVAHGYPGTTLAAVAAEAGVSVQTIYNAVGGKAALLKEVYDTTLAGDDAPVPMAERPEFRAVTEAPDARACLAAYAHLGRLLGERLAGLLPVLVAGAAAGDPDLGTFVEVVEGQRATGTTGVARHVAHRFGLRDGLDVDEAAAVLWVLTAPEVVTRLVTRRGWTWDRYEEWLAAAMADALVGASTA
jgi:AcrR family transcriptional regulator